MTVPVLTFFNNKGGVGKTSLSYHLSWMLSEIGHTVLVCDLDPQANLTSAFLDEDALDQIWNGTQGGSQGATIFQCVKPLTEVGDLLLPNLQNISTSLSLLPGDLALSSFESTLSEQWPNALGSDSLYRAFRILSSFWAVMQSGAEQCGATIIISDVGPNLGAINRSALIATDKVIVPLAADLFSLQGLRNLGPTLRQWRQDWRRRLENWKSPEFELPEGNMEPVGYIIQQHGVRLDRPVKAYDKWVNRMPAEYKQMLLGTVNESSQAATTPSEDEYCLATIRHYRSLVPMAQEHRKPIFQLNSADGAIGGHSRAVTDAYSEYKKLAEDIAEIAEL